MSNRKQTKSKMLANPDSHGHFRSLDKYAHAQMIQQEEHL